MGLVAAADNKLCEERGGEGGEGGEEGGEEEDKGAGVPRVCGIKTVLTDFQEHGFGLG